MGINSPHPSKEKVDSIHHNRRPSFTEAIPDIRAVEETLEGAVGGQVDEAVIASASAPSVAESDYQSDFSELEESNIPTD